ncbi:MAG: lysophospholipid acyltransferase family protein [Hyphomicrobiales bacterium]
MGRFRATYILTLFFLVTPPLMVFQWLLLRVAPRLAVTFPHVYHRNLCKRLIQARIHVRGEPVTGGPCLIAANHCSWLDITVFSAVKPLSFIAKREVGGWPLFGSLARLQRSIFVDRDRRAATAGFRDQMQARLRGGDTLVLFPEGTSTDGNRVLQFKSALMSAAETTVLSPEAGREVEVPVQPVTIAYTQLHGLPMARHERPRFTWYGDMDLAPHIWDALKRGPLDVVVHFHPPVTVATVEGRKALAAHCEAAVRAGLVEALTGCAPERAAIPAAGPDDENEALASS